jgi:hypothetical protein
MDLANRVAKRRHPMPKTNHTKKAHCDDSIERLFCGDCLDVLDSIPANYVDLFCSDPPYYGTGFMGNGWDISQQNRRTASQTVEMGTGMRKSTVTENREYQEWVTTWARKVRRVLKPGALAFTCMSPRQDLFCSTIAGQKNAGLDVASTSIYWTFATGFPKAMSLGDGSYSGFQLKPAVEVIVVAMKPLEEKTYKAQALSNGHGCTWLDDCRIPFQDSQGSRFPANLLVSDGALGAYSGFFSLDAWAERTLPFLIVPKPSKREKNYGLEGANPHCTVKPIQLMSYLITMGSRPGDTVLDCFLGSGTTGIAAAQLRRRFIGIEREPVYFRAAKRRMEAWKDKIA